MQLIYSNDLLFFNIIHGHIGVFVPACHEFKNSAAV